MPSSNDKLNEILNSIGATVEMITVMRDQLIANGFTRAEAIHMVTSVLTAMFQSGGRSNGR